MARAGQTLLELNELVTAADTELLARAEQNGGHGRFGDSEVVTHLLVGKCRSHEVDHPPLEAGQAEALRSVAGEGSGDADEVAQVQAAIE